MITCTCLTTGGWGLAVVLLVARCTLAAVLLLAGITKLFSPAATRDSAQAFGLPRALARLVAPLLPLLELATALLLLGDRTATVGSWLAVALMAAFTLVVALAVARRRSVACNCFGTFSAEPVSRRTLVRNVALLTASGAVAAAGARSADAALGLPYADFDAASWTIVALVGAVVIGATGAWHAFVLLLQQQGRLLLRVDALEGRLSADAPAAHQHEPETYGLPVGAEAPSFSLEGLHGETLTLESLVARGRPVLLEFADPHCGPCTAVAPVVARWQREHADELTVVVIAGGSLEDNRAKAVEHGLTTVLLDDGGATARAYGSPGTPSAVLVGADGRILSATVAGGPAVEALGAGITGASPAPTPTEGAVGQPAPTFSLPTLAGDVLSDDVLTGERSTVVLFWDPQCGFCQRMQTRLQHWDHQASGGDRTLLVVASRGAEANDTLGLGAPVLLDDGTLMHAFGANGTPMAVLVDPEGRIASPVAAGEEAVFDLLGAPPGADHRSLPLAPGGNA